jgi:Ca-activated chloride channel family protein
LKKSVLYTLLFLFALSTQAQYYLRGEVKDNKGAAVPNVKLQLKSSSILYYTGTYGGFGISTTVLDDSLTVFLDGYETKRLAIKSNTYQYIVLKRVIVNDNKNRQRLVSIIKDFSNTSKYRSYVGDESYFTIVENDNVDGAKFPNTGFSLNINKASYSNIRRFIHMKSSVPPDAVRIEEVLNYFNLNYKEPEKNETFYIESQFTDCPWNKKTNLLYLNINARKINMDDVPPSNLVFLVDISGSMDLPNRLPLVKAAFQLLVKNLREIDTVSIVTYGGNVQVWLPPTSGTEKEKITQAIEELTAGGDTPGETALRTAYRVAKRAFIKGGNNRIILATDGDFNVGEVTEKALEDLIVWERQSGLYLTCLGVGMGNYKDSKLETLAKKGNGNYAYLDNIAEAEKVLVKEMTQTLFTVADNVFLNVQFNPSIVKEYRLIGFDNKRDAIADSTGEMEGGEIGSGNSVMAVFEIIPQKGKITSADSALCVPIANLSLRYNEFAQKNKKELLYVCEQNYLPYSSLHKDLQFAGAVTMFSLKLRNSKYLPITDWTDIEKVALPAIDQTKYLQKEFINILAQAKKLYAKRKKK